MKAFSDLGEAVENRWRQLHYEESSFPLIAEQALRRFKPARAVNSDDVASWLIQSPTVPAQHNDASFGQPPVMLYRGTRFYIEILFWLDGSPSIHQHGFSGAFTVLAGSSIHTQYRFTLARQVTRNIRVGTLRCQSIELLRRGDVRQIAAGAGLIHSTFHLERPTLTIVVRTETDSIPTPQYQYLPPSIAYNPFYFEARLDRQLRILEALRECEDPAFVSHAEAFLRHTDFLAATKFLGRHYENWRESSPATFKRLLQVAKKRHGKLIDAWPATFAEDKRRQEIMSWRSRVKDPNHRFFLALVLNLSNRDAILSFIAKRFPGRSPKKLVLKWVGELTRPGTVQAQGALPMTLGAASLTVFGWLIEGLSWRQIVLQLKKRCNPRDFAHQQDNVAALVKYLKQSPLRPLFE